MLSGPRTILFRAVPPGHSSTSSSNVLRSDIR